MSSNNKYDPASEAEIVAELKNDPNFNFKHKGTFLTCGVCPQCGKKELYVSKDKPWRVCCSRLNKCGYSESTREIYPHLFNRYTERFPATPEDPNATANAYMAHNRRFDLEKIGDWFDQEHYRLPDSAEVAATVRFYLDQPRTRYWERLIDKEKSGGQRINFGGRRKVDKSLVRGDWWMPPGQVIDNGDEVYLVEGIFHAIAFFLCGFKVCATLMAGNYPSNGLAIYQNRAIRWRLALDDDEAGRNSMKRHRRKLIDAGERCDVVLSGSDKDWDDLYRLDKLDSKFLSEALWRGRMFTAKNINQRAWAFYAWKRRQLSVLEFGKKLYSVAIDGKLIAALDEHSMSIDERDAIEIFGNFATIVPISNCFPQFLYCERFTLTNELSYFYKIEFSNSNPSTQVSLPGSGIESPAAFNKSLLSQAAGATFDGGARPFKLVRDRWFEKGVLHVETVPFVGFDRDSRAYLFQSFAFLSGKQLELNEHGFFQAGGKPIKSKFKGFTIEQGDGETFNTGWFDDFMTVFGWNGLVALVFWFGSLFAEQIREATKSFPFLEITGEHGTGKSTLLEFLWKLTGRDDYEGFDPSKSTFAARGRAFMQVSNLPIVLIESDRDTSAKQKQFDFEELKTAFNGRAIRSLGVMNRGTDIEEPPFRGSIVIAQNAQVEGSPALLSRIIRCHFTSAHFTPESRSLAPKFEAASVENMAGFLIKCLSQESEILDRFNQVFPKYISQFETLDGVKDQRIIKVHSTLMALAHGLQIIVPEFKDEQRNQLNDYVEQLAQQRQKALNQDHPIVQSFWETYELLNIKYVATGSLVEKEQLNHSPLSEEIAISLTQFYQFMVESKVETISKSDMKKYLPGSKSHKYLGQKSIRSKILNRVIWCWVFKAGRG